MIASILPGFCYEEEKYADAKKYDGDTLYWATTYNEFEDDFDMDYSDDDDD